MIRTKTPLKQSGHLSVSNISKFIFHFSFTGLIKRAFDITAALIGLLILAPFFVIIIILIKRDSPGPIFYWGSRIGIHGATFKMLKFRTMYNTPKSFRG